MFHGKYLYQTYRWNCKLCVFCLLIDRNATTACFIDLDSKFKNRHHVFILLLFNHFNDLILLESRSQVKSMFCFIQGTDFYIFAEVSSGLDWCAMQRSRRALLHRRALEKVIIGRSRFYKVSLSLVFVLWGFVFLISLWFSRGDGHRGNLSLISSFTLQSFVGFP